MPPPLTLKETLNTGTHKCDLPFFDPDDGGIVFFDVQSAGPGTVLVPGVIDVEVYEPGELVESSWIYFKGDPQAGPQPGHPFEMPFNNSVKFSVDIVEGNDTSKVVHQLMPPTNSSKFWEGGAPFGRNWNYSMYIPQLDRSCEYYSVGAMLYRWSVPEDIERDMTFRLKLETDEPPTTHLSSKLRVSTVDAASSSSFGPVSKSTIREVLTEHMMTVGSAGLILLLLTFGFIIRFRRRPARIAL